MPPGRDDRPHQTSHAKRQPQRSGEGVAAEHVTEASASHVAIPAVQLDQSLELVVAHIAVARQTETLQLAAPPRQTVRPLHVA